MTIEVALKCDSEAADTQRELHYSINLSLL